MIAASSVRVGDSIRGLGVVLNVRTFCTPVATGRKGVLTVKAPYWQQVSEELNCCYDHVADRVVVETAGGSRCFFNDTLVDVIETRTMAAAA